jgi:hypothetical protein
MAYEKKTTPHGNIGKKRTLAQINGKVVQIRKPITAIDANGNEIHFDSITDAETALKIHSPIISILLRGHAKGYTFKYRNK